MRTLIALTLCICVIVAVILMISSNGCGHTRTVRHKPDRTSQKKAITDEDDASMSEGNTVSKDELEKVIKEIKEKFGIELTFTELEGIKDINEFLRRRSTDFSKLSTKELFKLATKSYIREGDIEYRSAVGSAALDELLRRELTAEELEWLLEKLKGVDDLRELSVIMDVLEANAERMDKKTALYFWDIVKDIFSSVSEIIKQFGEQGHIEEAVRILIESELGKEHYSGIIDDLMEMGKIDDACYRAAALFGKAAIEPLLKAKEEGKHSALNALASIKDTKAKDDLWKVVKRHPDYAPYAIEAYLNSGGKPPVDEIVHWLTKMAVDSPYIDAAIEASKYFPEDKRIGEALIFTFERGTEHSKYNSWAAKALWYSRTKVVREYLERVIKDKSEPKEKRGEIIYSLFHLALNHKVRPKNVEWTTPILKGIIDDPLEEPSIKSDAEDAVDEITRLKEVYRR